MIYQTRQRRAGPTAFRRTQAQSGLSPRTTAVGIQGRLAACLLVVIAMVVTALPVSSSAAADQAGGVVSEQAAPPLAEEGVRASHHAVDEPAKTATYMQQRRVRDGDVPAEKKLVDTATSDPSWVFNPAEPVPALFSGALHHSYPIAAPPSSDAVAPNLALSYSSRAADGRRSYSDSNQVGEGWALSGIPLITRANPILCSDNTTCWANDTFTLHMGGALTLQPSGGQVCGTEAGCIQRFLADDHPSVYVELRTENQADGVDDYWVVRGADGAEWRFGYRPIAKHVFNNADHNGSHGEQVVYRWFPDVVKQPSGGQMEFEYDSRQIPSCEGEDTCHEVDVWPTRISYDHHDGRYNAKLELGWENVRSAIIDDNSLLRTTKRLATIAAFARPSGSSSTYQQSWYYKLTRQNFPCYDSGANHPRVCSNNATIAVLASVQRFEKTGTTLPSPPTIFDYYGHNGGNEGTAATRSEAHIVGRIPGVPFDFHFRYPHLKSVDNGRGGGYEFAYESTGYQTNRQSWRIASVATWDGMTSTAAAPFQTRYITYDEPCFDVAGGCLDDLDPNDDSHILVGHRTVVTSTRDRAGNEIDLSHHVFVTDGDRLLFGRELQSTDHEPRSNPADAATAQPKILRSTNSYRLIGQSDTNVAHCPRGDWPTTMDWVCLEQREIEEFDDTPANRLKQRVTQKMTYGLWAQGPQQFQWGKPTHIDTLINGRHIRREINFFAASTNRLTWVNRPFMSAVRDGTDTATVSPQGYLSANFTLYDGSTNIDVSNASARRIEAGDLLTSTVAVIGEEPTFAPGAHLAVASSVEYDANGQPETTISFGAHGTVNLSGNVFGSYTPPPVSSARRTTITRDDRGRAATVTSPDSMSVTSTFDAQNKPWLVTSASVRFGPDANDTVVTSNEYDARGRLRSTSAPGATPGVPVVQSRSVYPAYPIDPSSGQTVTTTGFPNSGVALKSTVKTTVDGLGRVQEERTSDLVDDAGVRKAGRFDLVTTFTYDGAGRVVCTTEPQRVAVGAAAQPCASYPHKSTVDYDARGRVTSEIAPDGSATRTRYVSGGILSGLPTTSMQVETTAVGSDGVTHRKRVDGMDDRGRVLWAAEWDGGARYIVTTFGYDEAGNRNRATAGRVLNGSTLSGVAETTTFDYDSAGRRVAVDDPEVGAWRYRYNADGAIVQQNNVNGTICNEYDQFGRGTGQWIGRPGSGSPSDCAVVRHQLSRTIYVPFGESGAGHIKSTEYYPQTVDELDGRYRDEYRYDDLGRTTLVARKINDRDFITRATAFDDAGRVLRVINPAFDTVTTTYDAWGPDSLTKQSVSGVRQTIVDDMVSNDRGQLLTIRRGNGVSTTFDYLDVADAYRLDSTAVSNGSVLRQFDYDYDGIGQITRIDRGPDRPETELFSYDKLGRINTARVGSEYDLSYSYDNAGNLTGVTDRFGPNVKYTVNGPGSSQPQGVDRMQIGGAVFDDFAYDGVGNMTRRDSSEGVFKQTFDENGRLTSVEHVGDGTSERFVYDALGLRVASLDSEGAITYTPFAEYSLEEPGEKPTPQGAELRYTIDDLRMDTEICLEMYDPNGSRSDPPKLSECKAAVFLPQVFSIPASAMAWLPQLIVSNSDIDGCSITPVAPVRETCALRPDGATYRLGRLSPGQVRTARFTSDSGCTDECRSPLTDRQRPTGDLELQPDEFEPLPFAVPTKPPTRSSVTRVTYALAGSPVAVAVSGSDDDGLFHLHADHLGSSSFVTDAAGNEVEGSESLFRPFGGYRIEPTVDVSERGFTGHRENRGIGLTYMNARYYSAELRRFVSADTVVPSPMSSHGWNRHAYVNNNPINFTDPTGHYSPEQIENYVNTYECGGDQACTDATIKEWRADGEWWATLMEADGDDLIFGHQNGKEAYWQFLEDENGDPIGIAKRGCRQGRPVPGAQSCAENLDAFWSGSGCTVSFPCRRAIHRHEQERRCSCKLRTSFYNRDWGGLMVMNPAGELTGHVIRDSRIEERHYGDHSVTGGFAQGAGTSIAGGAVVHFTGLATAGASACGTSAAAPPVGAVVCSLVVVGGAAFVAGWSMNWALNQRRSQGPPGAEEETWVVAGHRIQFSREKRHDGHVKHTVTHWGYSSAGHGRGYNYWGKKRGSYSELERPPGFIGPMPAA